MLRQKCDAWREEVEKLVPLRDEVGRLHAHIGGLEEQIKSLQADNQSLGKQLVEESERKQVFECLSHTSGEIPSGLTVRGKAVVATNVSILVSAQQG